MTTYANLSANMQTVFLLVILLLIVGQIHHLLASRRKYVRLGMLILLIPSMSLLYFLLSALDHSSLTITALLLRRPYGQIVGFIFFDILITGALIISSGIARQTISIASIKESCDDLPTGLCYYNKQGRFYIVNAKMEELGRQISGRWLTNGLLFEKALQQPLSGKILDTKNGLPTIIFPDGRVWSFSRYPVSLHNQQITELVAADITDLYTYSRQLMEENRQLQDVNRRLRRHNQKIDEVVRNEELLNTRIRIHDDVGHCLLATRYYMTEGLGTSADIVTGWQHAAALLEKQSTAEPDRNVMGQLNDAAEAIGIKINIQGLIPTNDKNAEKLIVNATRECMTNAFKHGQAQNLNIKIVIEPLDYQVTFTNDGKPLDKPLVEGGGLSSLRKLVENQGGRMNIEGGPPLKITLFINRNGDDTE